jgi:excisionase family DNA binding protein
MNNLQIENVTVSEFSEALRQVVREELSILQPKQSTANYLTRPEVAKLLKISLPTLNEYTRKGIIRGSRIGSRVLYLESDITSSVTDIPAIKYRRG